MALDRLIPTSASPDPVLGTAFMDATQEELTGLWNASALRLTNVGGSADAITADVVPALTGGVVAGMSFWLTPTATITGPATLAIGGGAAMALVNDDGGALISGQLIAGRSYLLTADGTALRAYGVSAVAKVTDHQTFTADGTWDKPAGTPANALVVVHAWSAGGGGDPDNFGGGGGGGCFGSFAFRAGDLPSSVAVTIGTGAAGVAGGSTSFGALFTLFGGGAASSIYGGGGGGAFTAGAAGAPGGGAAGDPLGGNGGVSSSTDPIAPGDGSDGGGGGGAGSLASETASGQNGGRSIRGGGGGAGKRSNNVNNGVGGISLMGGNGGNVGAPGQAPGGGGGAGAAGGRGELRIWTIG